MDIIGKWKVNKVLQMGDAGSEWRTRDEVKDVEPEDVDEMFRMMMVFEEGGRAYSVMQIPEGVSREEIDAAVAEGEIKLCGDGLIALDESEWREQDGKIFYKTSVRGEIFGEEVDPWTELKEADGGFELMFSRFIKA